MRMNQAKNVRIETFRSADGTTIGCRTMGEGPGLLFLKHLNLNDSSRNQREPRQGATSPKTFQFVPFFHKYPISF
jgi:hypothetical protein